MVGVGNPRAPHPLYETLYMVVNIARVLSPMCPLRYIHNDVYTGCTHAWSKTYRHAEVDEDLSEFLNDGSWKRGYIANRLVVV